MPTQSIARLALLGLLLIPNVSHAGKIGNLLCGWADSWRARRIAQAVDATTGKFQKSYGTPNWQPVFAEGSVSRVRLLPLVDERRTVAGLDYDDKGTLFIFEGPIEDIRQRERAPGDLKHYQGGEEEILVRLPSGETRWCRVGPELRIFDPANPVAGAPKPAKASGPEPSKTTEAKTKVLDALTQLAVTSDLRFTGDAFDELYKKYPDAFPGMGRLDALDQMRRAFVPLKALYTSPNLPVQFAQVRNKARDAWVAQLPENIRPAVRRIFLAINKGEAVKVHTDKAEDGQISGNVVAMQMDRFGKLEIVYDGGHRLTYDPANGLHVETVKVERAADLVMDAVPAPQRPVLKQLYEAERGGGTVNLVFLAEGGGIGKAARGAVKNIRLVDGKFTYEINGETRHDMPTSLHRDSISYAPDLAIYPALGKLQFRDSHRNEVTHWEASAPVAGTAAEAHITILGNKGEYKEVEIVFHGDRKILEAALGNTKAKVEDYNLFDAPGGFGGVFHQDTKEEEKSWRVRLDYSPEALQAVEKLVAPAPR